MIALDGGGEEAHEPRGLGVPKLQRWVLVNRGAVAAATNAWAWAWANNFFFSAALLTA